MIKKPTKHCKSCKQPYDKSPEGKQIGLSRFCSISCYIRYQSKTKTIKKETITKEVDTSQNQKRFISKSQLKRISSLMAIEKSNKPERDSTYLEFVRGFPCLVCKQPSTAHHVENNGMSSKGSDYLAISLCYNHHVANGDSVHRLGNEEFQKKFNVNFKDQQIKLLTKYIKLLKAIK